MKNSLVFALLAGCALAACGQPGVSVDGPWIRATVAEQKTSAAYLTITSSESATLVSVTTPLTSAVEIHEMKMDGDIMRMRAVPGPLPLPAGQKVEFKPGGYHMMLLGLRHALKPGDVVPLTLEVQGADGKQTEIQVRAPVK